MDDNYQKTIVYYLEKRDVDDKNKLKNYATQNLPVIVMVKSDNCGHCVTAFPEFEKLAKDFPDQLAARCIRREDKDGDELLQLVIQKWYTEFRGFPTYLGFDSKGNYVKHHDGGRDSKSLLEFAKSL